MQRIGPYYARTLDMWAAVLEAHGDEAIAIQSEEMFRDRYTDLCQFTRYEV
nr:class I SAM-dependent methyltransferase [Mycobacterium sp. ACS1612]